MYDDDKCVKADLIISGTDFLNMLTPYEGNSEILDSYIANLKNILNWYIIHGDYRGNKNSFWEWNIANHHIAQYRLMRDIFPEVLWKNRECSEYKVYHGNSFGRPWTQMQICKRYYKEHEDYYSVFWRIDTDNNGPYISLRLYYNYNKHNIKNKSRHQNLYESISKMIEDIVDAEFDFSLNDVYPGYRGNYKESSLFHIKLKDKLLDWDKYRDSVISDITKFSTLFCEKIESH